MPRESKRLRDLRIAGIIPQQWPQYYTPTEAEILAATRDETLPWELPRGAVKWNWRRLFERCRGGNDGPTFH
jgi:hypothetical protein